MRVSRTRAFFDQLIFVSDEQGVNNRIEKDLVKNIFIDKKIDFLIDTSHINLPNTAEEIIQKETKATSKCWKT